MSGTGQKRNLLGAADGNGRKHPRRDDEIEQSHTQGKIDPTFGQRSAFPGLDDYTLTGDDILDHDDELGALSYLRSVRQEASSIPTVLTAPKPPVDDQSIYEDGVGDSRGWYSEGAYTAAPLPSTSGASEYDPIGRDPQTAFYESLISKYEVLRTRLNQTPPIDIQEKLDLSVYPTHAKQSKEGGEEWNLRLRNNSPNPVQLALMKKWSILRLLTLLTTEDAVLRRGMEINENTSLWLWGLLARVPERGEMNSEQIAIVRELGKKAVLVRLGFQEAEDWNDGLDAVEAEMRRGEYYDPEFAEESADIDASIGEQLSASEEELIDLESRDESIAAVASPSKDGLEFEPLPSSDITNESNPSAILTSDLESEELAAAKARLLSAVNAEEPDLHSPEIDTSVPSKNTRVTLDMILTVAGEVYGQRDLLEFREKWDEIVPPSTYW